MVIIHVAIEGIDVVWEDLCCAQYIVLRLSVVLQILKVVVEEVLQDLTLILLRLFLGLATRCEDLHEAGYGYTFELLLASTCLVSVFLEVKNDADIAQVVVCTSHSLRIVIDAIFKS